MSLIEVAADAVMPRWQRMLLGAAAVVLVLSAVGGGAFYQGWSMRGDREVAVAAKAKKAADDARVAAVAAEKVRGDKLAVQLEDEKRNIKTVTIEVIKEIPKVTTVYVEAPGETAKPIPPAIYTVGFVRLWDRALVGSSGLRTGASEPAGAAGAADTLRARIDSPDVLANAAENFGKYAECRSQLNALIDWELGRTKPAHGQ